jgi:hypothetical protein
MEKHSTRTWHTRNRPFILVIYASCATSVMVPGEGVEPSRPFGQRILSPLCLPFHHPGISLAASGGIVTEPE